MAHRALACLLAGATCLLAACRGCDDEAAAPKVRASQLSPIESQRIGLADRRAARKIDAAKTLTTDAAGVTQCGEDRDCFVLTAERCVPAVLEHTQVLTLFGLEQRVAWRYTIVGETDGGCALRRDLLSLGLEVSPELRTALHAKGKTDEEIAKLKAETYERLQERSPARVSCKLSGDEALEAALDLADGKYDSKPWRDKCTEQQVD
jgi:hypothetical protein